MDDVESSTETESPTANTPKRKSDYEAENFFSVCVTSEEDVRHIRTETVSLTQQLDHFCDLMLELKNEQAYSKRARDYFFERC